MVSLITVLAACSSSPGPQESASQEPVDIYEQLKSGNVQYANEAQPEEKGSPEYVLKNLKEARAAYFRKDFDQAQKLCKRILSLVPTTTEAYYWLARIAMDQGDFQQAYDMSSKGLMYAREASMKGELERINKISQMGAR